MWIAGGVVLGLVLVVLVARRARGSGDFFGTQRRGRL